MVGIFEVMEHYIPRFFTNVAATYKLYMQDKPKNKINIKPKVSKKIKDLVADNFTVFVVVPFIFRILVRYETFITRTQGPVIVIAKAEI